MRNQKKTEKSRSKRAKTRSSTSCDETSKTEFLNQATNSDDKKCSSFSDKDTTEIKLGENIEDVGHKLAIHKPWFSHSLSIDYSIPLKSIPVSDSIVSQESVHIAVQSIPDTSHIHDIYQHIGINQGTQDSSSTEIQRESRLRPRVKVDKISKWFIL
jgi:hypothetical protein